MNNIYIYIYRRFRGDRTACPPPVTGRSASFRLRFRFVRVVRVVRAGEAKLRGRMQTVVLIAGPPGCEYPCVCARLSASLLCTGAWVLRGFWSLLEVRARFSIAKCMGFKALTCFLFDSTVLGEHDLQKHLVK